MIILLGEMIWALMDLAGHGAMGAHIAPNYFARQDATV